MNVGFIGIGRMGEPMARNILRAGHQVAAYNRTSERAHRLAGDGARVAGSPADAAARAEVVVTMLADDAAVAGVVEGDDGLASALPAGATHVSMSTISVALARRLAALHAARGQQFVSAPVFGRPDAAAAAKLFVVAAGPAPAVAACDALFQAVGQRTFVVGEDAPAANVVKLAGNFMLQSAVESMSEAFALARKAGIEPDRFLDVLTNTLFTAPIYKAYGSMIAADRYEPPGFALGLALKDVRLALDAGKDAGVRMPVAEVLQARFETAIERGYRELDMAALGRVASEDAGL
jgi:3-hydroxyisobutyrate dehydrogenase-like beta-hydroxyacid dehydrogenase